MEGPSLLIAREEFSNFKGKTIDRVSGTAKLKVLKGARLTKADSWGKHLLLSFTTTRIRIHFLMFGSYRIDNPRPNRFPKLEFKIGDHKIYFYSCAIKELPKGFEKDYDRSIDLMSAEWNPRQAEKTLSARPQTMICDALMDQEIFAGLGNIMKNEILFNLKLHPETKLASLDRSAIRKVVKEAHRYSWQFYQWKKINQLKRNWKIMRKKTCPNCGGKVRKRATGKLQRISHFCPRCQPKPATKDLPSET